jgi:hypothetical protein
MATELSSTKYLPAELRESIGLDVQEGDIAVTATDQPIADPSQAFASPSYQPSVRKPSTGFVTFLACFLALAGVLGILGGAFGAVGQAAISNSDSSQITQALSRGGNRQEAEIYRRTMENQKKFSLVMYLHNGICVLVGLGFVASSIVLFTRKTEANSFAATAFCAAIFYNCMTVAVTWATMPSLKGISGMPEGAATAAFAVGVGFVAIMALVKIGFYGIAIAYLSRPNVKAIFNPQANIA